MELLRARSIVYLFPLSVKQIAVLADYLGVPRAKNEKKLTFIEKVIDGFIALSQAERNVGVLQGWVTAVSANMPVEEGGVEEPRREEPPPVTAALREKIMIPGGPEGLGSPGGPAGLGSPGGPAGLGSVAAKDLNRNWERRFEEMKKDHEYDMQQLLAAQVGYEARELAKREVPDARVSDGEDQRKINEMIEEARSDTVVLSTERRSMSQEQREGIMRRIEMKKKEIGILIVKDEEGAKVANLLRGVMVKQAVQGYKTGLDIDKARREARRLSRRDEEKGRRRRRGSSSDSGSPPAKRRRTSRSQQRETQVTANLVCYACNRVGHIAPHCPDGARREVYVNATRGRFAGGRAHALYNGGYSAGGGGGGYSAGGGGGGYSAGGGGYSAGAYGGGYGRGGYSGTRP
jgi:hypothetical protein